MRERIVGFLLIVAALATIIGTMYGLTRFMSADLATLIMLVTFPVCAVLWKISGELGTWFMGVIGK